MSEIHNSGIPTSYVSTEPHISTEDLKEQSPQTGTLGSHDVSTGKLSSEDEGVKSEMIDVDHALIGELNATGELSAQIKVADEHVDSGLVDQIDQTKTAPKSAPLLSKAITDAPRGSEGPLDPPRLPTSTQLREQAGEAKSDIKLFGKTVHAMSTDYKAVLTALDAYHNLANQMDVGPHSDVDIDTLNTLLDQVEHAATKYSGSREGIAELKEAVDRERALLKEVQENVQTDPKKSISWSSAANKLRELELGADGPQFKGIVSDAKSLQSFLDKIPVGNGSQQAAQTIKNAADQLLGKIANYQGNLPEVSQIKASLESLKNSVDILTSNPELIKGRTQGLGNAMSWAKAVEVAPGLRGAVTDDQRRGGLEVLGKGAVNTVYKAEFGESREVGVVKFDLQAFPLDPMNNEFREAPDVSRALNMSDVNPQLSQRSVASYDTVAALGFDISPKVEFAVVDGSLATVMGMAQGKANDKKIDAPLISMTDLQAYGRARVDAYQDFENKLSDLGKASTEQGLSQPVADRLMSEFRGIVQDNKAPKADSIEGMDATQFQKAFGRSIVVGSGETATRGMFVKMEGGLGFQPIGEDMKPIPDKAPLLLLSKEDFHALVQSANEGQTREKALQDNLTQGKDAWAQNRMVGIFNTIRPDGSVRPNALSSYKNIDGVLCYERPAPMDIPYDDPSIVKGLAELQLTDFLTGQVDRHSGNYFIYPKEDGSYGISSIDGDMSWGDKETGNDSGPRFEQPDRLGHSRSLPTVIDSRMRDAVNSLKGEKLEELKTKLSTKLTDSQIAAFEERLEILKGHIGDSSKCTVIEPDEWETHPAVTESLKHPESSYAARERDNLEGYRQEGIPITQPNWDQK